MVITPSFFCADNVCVSVSVSETAFTLYMWWTEKESESDVDDFSSV